MRRPFLFVSNNEEGPAPEALPVFFFEILRRSTSLYLKAGSNLLPPPYFVEAPMQPGPR
jgi:hypothetical protein